MVEIEIDYEAKNSIMELADLVWMEFDFCYESIQAKKKKMQFLLLVLADLDEEKYKAICLIHLVWAAEEVLRNLFVHFFPVHRIRKAIDFVRLAHDNVL